MTHGAHSTSPQIGTCTSSHPHRKQEPFTLEVNRAGPASSGLAAHLERPFTVLMLKEVALSFPPGCIRCSGPAYSESLQILSVFLEPLVLMLNYQLGNVESMVTVLWLRTAVVRPAWLSQPTGSIHAELPASMPSFCGVSTVIKYVSELRGWGSV